MTFLLANLPLDFSVAIALFFLGAIGALLLRRNDHLANLWSNFFAIMGSIFALSVAVSVIFKEQIYHVDISSGFPLLHLSLDIDQLAAFFVGVIALISIFCSIYGIGYLTHFYKTYNIGLFGFFYNLFIASLLLLVTASNGLFFLILWEIMSITSYFLVVYDRNEAKNISAGLLYILMTLTGTAFIVIAFITLFIYTGSFNFLEMKSAVTNIPPLVQAFIFVTALIGFGTKAGIIPFHIWLPEAHPAAPSHVSGIMSGVMIKMGIYMFIRLFVDILGPLPLWEGVVVLVIGIVSSLLGVLYALTEHDIKRLLAYHSIENIGIILLGLGSALIFITYNLQTLAIIALVAALFHTLNHAVFKSLLFLSAGAVIQETHTKNMEEYGGIIKRMPQTAFFFLIGAMGITALPPLNGFFSEWLTYQAFIQGMLHTSASIQLLFVTSAAALALTGGLALACFVKVFGITFLARPRSDAAAKAHEVTLTMRIGMASLALLTVALGIFSGPIVHIIKSISTSLITVTDTTTASVTSSLSTGITITNGFANTSALMILLLIVTALAVTAFIAYRIINRNQTVTISETWNCGTLPTPRMEITATGFARSIVLIFATVLKPSLQHNVEYHDADSRYLQKKHSVQLHIGDIYYTYLYNPLVRTVDLMSRIIRLIQNGNVNQYIMYIFLALLVSLFLAL